jgi:hypothetical protein
MSQKQRLKQLEKKTHGQFLAFFVLPRGLRNRKEIELQLWDDYVKNGGNKTARAAFLSHLGDACGFVCCTEVSSVNEWLANNAKHPRH